MEQKGMQDPVHAEGHTQPYSYHSDSSAGTHTSGSPSVGGALGGGPLMLLTRAVLSDRMAWFLAPPVTAGSPNTESRNMESTVKEGPRKACRLSSDSATLQGMLADVGRARGPYSLELWVRAGHGSTRTGCRLSLERRSWMLVLRTVPSAVEMTLLARGRPEELESRRSDTDSALLWDARPARGGAEPLARVLSALRRLGRPGGPESGAAALPLAERRIPRPFTRSLAPDTRPG